MFLPFIGVSTPIEQKTVNMIDKPPAIVRQIKPELTTDQKIATNFYKCNTELQWIRKDNAQCLDKVPQATSQRFKQPTHSSVSVNGNSYELHSCTWWVKTWKPSVGNWGNASNWGYAAQSEGWVVNDTPSVGAIAWSTRGYYGHVALVIGVSGSVVTIQEGNWDWAGSVRTIEVASSYYRYIH